jgi:hypothetical protein
VRVAHVYVLTAVPGGFSPNGDRQTDAWTASWRLEAPAVDATVAITTSAGAAVRTLPARVSGSTVSVTWDGTTSSGSAAASGSYQWRLTGTTVGGSAIGRHGSDGVSGTVGLSRWLPRVTLRAPTASLTTSARPAVSAAWRVTTGLPSWAPETYEVQMWDGTWVPWLMGTRSHLGVWTRTVHSGDDLRLRVRLHSLGGLVSPWVTTTTQLLTDDLTLARQGSFMHGWLGLTQDGAFDRTARKSTSAQASFLTSQTGVRRVRVYATTCRSCGRVQISVTGSSWGEHSVFVDTYAASSTRRVLVADVLLPRAQSVRVSMHNLGTSGRPSVYVDALALWR